MKLFLNTQWKKVIINEKEKNIPNDWNVCSFSTFGKFQSGKDHKNINDGNYPVYGSSKQPIRFVNKFIHKGNTFVIGRKGTIDNPYYCTEPFWCVDTALYFDNKFSNSKFLFYKSLYINWLNYNAGSTVPSLVQSTVNLIEFSFPNEKEQELITLMLDKKEEHISSLNVKLNILYSKLAYLQNSMLYGYKRIELSANKLNELLDKHIIYYENENLDISFLNIKEDQLDFFTNIIDINKDINIYNNDNWKELEVNEIQQKLPIDWDVDFICKKINFIKGKAVAENKLNYNGQGLKYLKTTEFWLDSASKKDTVHYNGNVEEKYIKRKDEYVFSMDGFNNKISEGTLGLISNEDEGIVSTSFYKLEKNNIYHLIVNVLKSNYVQNFIMRVGEGTTVYHAGKYIKSIQGIFPKSTVEQKLLSMIFEKEEKLIDSLKEKIKYEVQLFKYLQQELLSGRIRIKDED